MNENNENNTTDHTMETLAHLAALSAVVTGAGMVLGPLIVWLIKKDDSPAVDMAGREAINFNISWFIWLSLAALSAFLLIGLVIFPILAITWLILVIRASLAASHGESYKYPLTIHFL